MIKLIIISSIFFFFFKLLNSINAESCTPSSCKKDGYSPIIRYPFRINDQQPKSCGMPGFDISCNDFLGPLIHLPNDVLLIVEGIFYDRQQIFLSDSNYDDCLPQKLLSLNLDNTPFSPLGSTKDFWLYNCSNSNSIPDYDQIECFSSSDFTIISAETEIMKNVDNSSCKLMKILNVPVSYSSMQLTDVSTINLRWDGMMVPPLPPAKVDSESGFSSVKPKVGMAICVVAALTIVIIGCYRYRRYINERATSAVAPRTIIIAPTSADENEIGGLDKVTIDSYPMVVIGESGRLIKGDDTCSICLSDYRPLETLKILPECLHRFHVECIDQWLCSKGVCPICRTSPSRMS